LQFKKFTLIGHCGDKNLNGPGLEKVARPQWPHISFVQMCFALVARVDQGVIHNTARAYDSKAMLNAKGALFLAPYGLS